MVWRESLNSLLPLRFSPRLFWPDTQSQDTRFYMFFSFRFVWLAINLRTRSLAGSLVWLNEKWCDNKHKHEIHSKRTSKQADSAAARAQAWFQATNENQREQKQTINATLINLLTRSDCVCAFVRSLWCDSFTPKRRKKETWNLVHSHSFIEVCVFGQ